MSPARFLVVVAALTESRMARRTSPGARQGCCNVSAAGKKSRQNVYASLRPIRVETLRRLRRLRRPPICGTRHEHPRSSRSTPLPVSMQEMPEARGRRAQSVKPKNSDYVGDRSCSERSRAKCYAQAFAFLAAFALTGFAAGVLAFLTGVFLADAFFAATAVCDASTSAALRMARA